MQWLHILNVNIENFNKFLYQNGSKEEGRHYAISEFDGIFKKRRKIEEEECEDLYSTLENDAIVDMDDDNNGMLGAISYATAVDQL